MALQHEITAAKAGLFDRENIHRTLHDAEQAVVPSRVGALGTKCFFAERTALLAVPHLLHRPGKRLGQTQPPTAIALKHLQGHALGGLLPYARKDSQGIDELADKGAEAHGYLSGSWKLEAGSWKLEAGSWKLEAGSESAGNPMNCKRFLQASSFKLMAAF